MKRSFGTHERGAAGIGVIVALIILALAVYVGITMIPIYAAYYDLKDKLEQDILFAQQRFTGDLQKAITEQVYLYLDEMGINVTYEKKDVSVKVHKTTKAVAIKFSYIHSHKIPGFPKQFDVDVQGKYAL
jgi:hypothetical protein